MAAATGVEYLRTFPDFERGNVSAAQTFGLERVLALLEEVGSPHTRVPVIHVAGTKGKGSTSACIAAITRAAGYRTGLFTQPHLVRMNERFTVDGAELDDSALSAIMLDQIQPAVARLADRGVVGIQQFEAQVALAMLWFESEHVDVAVLEVGLGGRLDGTNVVSRPLVTTLTAIGFDHMAILGNTLPEIAGEKAAIVKQGVATVASPQQAEAAAVFVDRCRAMNAPLLLGDRDWQIENGRTSMAGTTFDLRLDPQSLTVARDGAPAYGSGPSLPVPTSRIADLHTPLLGLHQATNAGTAALTALVASRSLPRIDVTAIRLGLASVRWPGRLQVVARNPYVILDGAHTPESAVVLATAMDDLFPGRPVTLIFGIQSDKDIPGVARGLGRLTRSVMATAAHHPRAASTEIVAAVFAAAGSEHVEQYASPLEALAAAKEMAGPDEVIVVTGSLYVVGEILGAAYPNCISADPV